MSEGVVGRLFVGCGFINVSLPFPTAGKDYQSRFLDEAFGIIGDVMAKSPITARLLRVGTSAGALISR